VLDRRDFLIRASVALAAGASGLAACVPEEDESGVDPLAEPGLSQAKFTALVGTWFHLRGGEVGDCDVLLAAVIPGPVVPGTDQFTLRLRADRPLQLGSGVYEFSHRQMESFEAWIDPTPSSEAEPEYTGIFNLMPEPIAPS
jgi:hypothetical protein